VVGLSIDRQVRQRAGGVCEYCHFPESIHASSFQIDHIVSRQHRGQSTTENLALACHFCNLHKGPNVGGIDLETGALVQLFNPRIDTWSDHFRIEDAVILGTTAIGRITVHLLAMNAASRLEVRRAAIAAGLMKS
jgi:hypothetical protein